jgi:hypothetical protein
VSTYDERLAVPLRWWVQGTMFVATLWLAFVVAVPGVIPWLVGGGALGLMIMVFTAYGSVHLRVEDGFFVAGPAKIEARYLGEASALDQTQARAVAGPQADARAYLLLRPYALQAVKVAINDPDDPAPYWLVSTRHPTSLAAALAELNRA